MARRILVVEDNPDISHLVTLHLKDNHYDVTLAKDGAIGLKLASSKEFELIILDLMLPSIDGLEVCREIRKRGIYTPVLMLTAKTAEIDRVLGLEVGADDYLTKPFSIRELIARVKALLRRIDVFNKGSASEEEHLKFGELTLNIEQRSVTAYGNPVDLTAKEFDLLLEFAHHPGRVFSRSQLLDKVWGHSHEGYEHTVNSHINRLRSKIEQDPANPKFVLTVWGVGYKFNSTLGS